MGKHFEQTTFWIRNTIASFVSYLPPIFCINLRLIDVTWKSQMVAGWNLHQITLVFQQLKPPIILMSLYRWNLHLQLRVMEMFWASTILWKGFIEIECIKLKFVHKFMQKDNSSIAIESTTWVLQRSFSREYQLHYQNLSSYVRLTNYEEGTMFNWGRKFVLMFNKMCPSLIMCYLSYFNRIAKCLFIKLKRKHRRYIKRKILHNYFRYGNYFRSYSHLCVSHKRWKLVTIPSLNT